ncbi:MAG TPA: hypothetical protein VGL92_07270, partial [Acidimicrobiia bacterium]
MADEDLAAVGGLAQARRLRDRCAEAVSRFETDIARADPDAGVEPGVARRGSVVPVERPLDGHGAVDGVGRPGEGGHDPVTKTLDDPALVELHRFGQ